MVITSAESIPQIRAICKEIEEGVMKIGVKKPKWHGLIESNWMILDLGSVIVHVMTPEERQKYNLEELWGKTAVIYHP